MKSSDKTSLEAAQPNEVQLEIVRVDPDDWPSLSKESIDNTNGKRATWRATFRLPIMLEHLPGIFGGRTSNGPWIDGFGSSPMRALEDLQRRLGAAVMHLGWETE